MNLKKHKILIKSLFVTFLILIISNNIYARRTKYIFKLATLAPKSVGWAKHIREIIFPGIKNVTNGEVMMKMYWNGTMGNEEDYIRLMKAGRIDGAAFSGFGSIMACPEMAVLELPFIFKNYEEVDYIRKIMYPEFEAIIEKNGYKLILWTDQDFDQIYSVKYDMTTPEHFKKSIFVSCFGTLEKEVLMTLGADPIPMTVKAGSTAIRKGLVDAFIGPAMWVVGSQMYTVVKYVNPIKIRYSPAIALITLESWNKVPEDYQRHIQSFRYKEAVDFCNKNRIDSKRAFDAMIKYGLKVSEIDKKVLNDIKNKTKPLWYNMAGKVYEKKTLDTLLMHLNAYRKKNNN